MGREGGGRGRGITITGVKKCSVGQFGVGQFFLVHGGARRQTHGVSNGLGDRDLALESEGGAHGDLFQCITQFYNGNTEIILGRLTASINHSPLCIDAVRRPRMISVLPL